MYFLQKFVYLSKILALKQFFLSTPVYFKIKFSVADFMCCDVERVARMISVPVEV